jgi:glycosyl transferase family 25
MDIPLDEIYYINLDHRTDKRRHIETNVLPFFKDTHLDSRITRFPAIYHENGAIGCALSHLAVARKAQLAGARYYLVFEDDYEFLITKSEFLEWIASLFSPPQLDFKVVMLAYNAIHYQPYSSILNISTNVQTTAGFIVNCTYLEELIECWENGIKQFADTGEHWNWACDQSWKILQKEKWFIASRRIGKQISAISDIGHQWVNPIF